HAALTRVLLSERNFLVVAPPDNHKTPLSPPHLQQTFASTSQTLLLDHTQNQLTNLRDAFLRQSEGGEEHSKNNSYDNKKAVYISSLNLFHSEQVKYNALVYHADNCPLLPYDYLSAINYKSLLHKNIK